MQYDKSFLTDECYALHETTDLILNGVKENIIRAKEKLAEYMSPLKVHRIYMTNQEIKVIINNLKTIKQEIHPGEIRCSRDNALRDINHPFHTIYYKDKEVALVGTEETIKEAIRAVHRDVSRDKEYAKHSFSLNYLLPECSKPTINDIKVKIEDDYRDMGAKLIVYEPQAPRKNVSLTLVANYDDFPKVYEALKKMIDSSNILNDFEKFEAYQNKLLYQMNKYFFKYLQNYFQTKSIIFMKTWETIASDYGPNCSKYNNSFRLTRSKYVRDHELKFYIISVNRLTHGQQYKELSLDWKDVVLVLKSMVNKVVLSEPSMSVKNFQTVLHQSPGLREFIDNYKPTTYFSEYASEKLIDFERRLRDKLLDPQEQEDDPDAFFWRREQNQYSRPYNTDRSTTRYSRLNFRQPEKLQLIEPEPEQELKLETTVSAPAINPQHSIMTEVHQPLRVAGFGEGIVRVQQDLAFLKDRSVSSIRNSENGSSSECQSYKKDRSPRKQKEKKKPDKSSESKDSRKKSRREQVRQDFKLMKEKMDLARKESAKTRVSEVDKSPKQNQAQKKGSRGGSSSSSSSSKSSSTHTKSSRSRKSRSGKSPRKRSTQPKKRRSTSSSSRKSEKSSPVRKVKYTFGGSNNSASETESSASSKRKSESGSRSKKPRISKFKTGKIGRDRKSTSSSSRSDSRKRRRESPRRKKIYRDSSEENNRSRPRNPSIDKSSAYKRTVYSNPRTNYLGKR